MDIDLIKDDWFKEANEAYKSAVKELKTLGLGTIDHYPAMTRRKHEGTLT